MNINDFGALLGILTIIFIISTIFFTNPIILITFIAIVVIIAIANLLNKLHSKRRGVIKPSRLFLNKLEIHLGNEAKGSPRKFYALFIDNIIWAKENNIKRVDFFSWLNKEKEIKKLLGDSVIILNANPYQSIGNKYLNLYYWKSASKNPLLKFIIDTSIIDEVTMGILKEKSVKFKKAKNYTRSN